MISPSAKRRTVYMLFAVAILLLVSNLLLNKLLPKANPEHEALVLSGLEINNHFLQAVNNFGLEEDWIVVRKLSNKTDSLFSFYEIKLPPDLPIPALISEIKTEISSDSVEIKSIEKKMGSKTKLEIYSGGFLKLTSDIDYDKDLVRKRGSVGFLIEVISFDDQEDSLLFDVPESFAVLLIPSKENKKHSKFILNKSKEFALLLNDEIDDLEFKLSEDYSNNRILNSVKSIIGSFSKAIFFVIDDDSEIFRSKVFPVISAELKKRNIKLLLKSAFHQLENDEETDLINSFDSIFKQLAEDKLIILSNVKDFRLLLPEIVRYRKVGFKFINPSLIED
jgi:hypothetical protein